MEIVCPHCGQAYDADESYIGQTVECQVCGKGFVVEIQEKKQPIPLSSIKDSEKEEAFPLPPMLKNQEKKKDFGDYLIFGDSSEFLPGFKVPIEARVFCILKILVAIFGTI